MQESPILYVSVLLPGRSLKSRQNKNFTRIFEVIEITGNPTPRGPKTRQGPPENLRREFSGRLGFGSGVDGDKMVDVFLCLWTIFMSDTGCNKPMTQPNKMK